MVSEASGPCFHDADLDFENVYFEEDTNTIFHENIPTKEKENLHQEAPTFCCSDTVNMAENVEEEPADEAAFQGELVVNMGKSQQECYTGSWGDAAWEGGDEEDEGEEMKSGKQLLLAYIGDKYQGSSKGDGVPVERRPPAPEVDGNTPVRNEEQGGTESDEISYFQRVPEHGSKTEKSEDDQQEIDEAKTDSESEAGKSEEEEEEEEEQDEDDYDGDEYKEEEEEKEEEKEEEEDNDLAVCFEQEVKNPHWDDPTGDILDSLELRVQYLHHLMVNDEEPVQKMEDFSGEDHQEAGESFAEYPSDFSSCEYIEQGEGVEERNSRCPGEQVTVQGVTDSETLFVGSRETKQLKAELVETMSGDLTAIRWEISDSYSGDEEPNVTSEDVENQLDQRHSGSRDDLFVDDEGFPDVTLCPAEGVGMSSGCLDDFFFSSAERQNPQISELGEVGDDEYEEKNNWEQEQERIRAFNEFYEDSDQLTGQEGTGKSEGEGHFPQIYVLFRSQLLFHLTGRQTKVQFCPELFSQVILYEIDR